MLAMELEISLGDGVGVEAAIGPARCGALRPCWAAYAAVDHDLSDMDILGLKLSRHALNEAGQTQLAHGEGR
jgi:hypothetical protein